MDDAVEFVVSVALEADDKLDVVDKVEGREDAGPAARDKGVEKTTIADDAAVGLWAGYGCLGAGLEAAREEAKYPYMRLSCGRGAGGCWG